MPITKTDIEEFISLYTAGATMSAMARRYRCDHRTLKRVLRKRQIVIRSAGESRILSERHRPPRHGYPESEVVACYKAGASQPEMKEIFGISPKHVRAVMERNNVPMRTRSEAKALQMGRLSYEQAIRQLAAARAGYSEWVKAGNKRAARGEGKRTRPSRSKGN